MATYLITGGAGFIGSHLADRLLANGDSVRVLDDLSTGHRHNLAAEAELIVGSICDPAMIRQAIAGCDGVFHLAAVASVQKSIDCWGETHNVNSQGAVNVFEAAKDAGKLPVVFASSAATYGNNTAIPLSENEIPQPISFYGADKLANEVHAGLASLAYGMRFAGMRFFNVYGPRQDPSSPYSGVISIFVNHTLSDRQLQIFGTGEQTRDFVFVSDVAASLHQAMKYLQNSTQPCFIKSNVCRGQEVSILDLAREITHLAGKSGDPLFRDARQGDIMRSKGDPSRLNTEIGHVADVSLQDGLRALLDWEQAQRAAK
ncbi:NAD-dependent epimerase/dehydratase family protein [Thalassospira marina]|uniref:Epimerase n=1 Tax=Thalassospira marina TaxID=2048283 RepID=A0A2N3KD06_9PROT|nr:NAD-dependent epimerase/dehydratase family protein [Thalassospira marina]PKR48421.1 epimerase [Thalassospira marina]